MVRGGEKMANMTLNESIHSPEDSRESNYSSILNKSLRVFFKDAVRVTVKNPAQAYFFFRTLKWQRKAAGLRASWKRQGIHVPPILIFSITDKCNLNCKGCYHHALRHSLETELSDAELKSIVAEARDMGISFHIIAGGEPLTRKELLPITSAFPDIIFFIFTNGLLINDEMIKQLKKQRNVVPILSLEGFEKDTDERRGKGVYRHLQDTMKKLKSHGVFFGTSMTVTSTNFNTMTDEKYVRHLFDNGCRLFFFAEYTPVSEGTEGWVITEEQRAELADLVESFRSRFSSLFISVPGDEEQFGGCLSAGRGFIHISSEGNVEPCPFAPYSDSNLREVSLKQALQSDLLRRIRENNELSVEGHGGCVLWEERQWIQSLITGKTKEQEEARNLVTVDAV
jgi:MoaA/NifB/PqqE/SkfB family radical SAM enzyme